MMRIQLSREYKDQPLLKRVATCSSTFRRFRLHNHWIINYDVLNLIDLFILQVRELEAEEMLKNVALHFE